MATDGGGWRTVYSVGSASFLLLLLLVGSGSSDVASEYQPHSATVRSTSCQPLCWSSRSVPDADRTLLWSVRTGINQYWECLRDRGQWFAQLRTCPRAGMRFHFERQACVFPPAGSGGGSGAVCMRRNPPIGVQPLADGNDLCPEPSCVSQVHIETLWGYPDPAFFLQCRPVPDGSWRLELMPCAAGTWFHFRQQVCVDPLQWEACDGSEGGPGGTTTPAITTPELTTPDPDDTPAITTPEQTTNDGLDDLDPCAGPRCTTQAEINTLWVHPSPNYFYQCRPFPNGWGPQEMPCGAGTLFSFFHQVCVHSFEWEDPCGVSTTTTVAPPVTTEEPPVTTEEPPVTTEEPPVTTEEPPVTTEEPPVTTEQTTAETPEVDTTAPNPPSLVDCLTPNCMLLQDEVIRLPSRSGPQFYFRCVFLLQTLWLPFEDACPVGQYFSFLDQDCVDPSQWIDLCPPEDDLLTTTQMTTVEPEPTATPPEMPLPVVCGSPRCTTPAERSILWPSTVANMYYRCVWVERLFQFVPFPERCSNFYLFDFQRQECVFPIDWVDICPMFPTLPPTPCTDCCPTCPPPSNPPGDPEMPLPIICGFPRCVTEQERNFLWPALNAQDYYECVANGDEWVQATLQQCPGELLFQTLEQACVPPAEYDATFCPVYPPPPLPSTTELPAVDVCLEVDEFDPSPVLPIICDIARCQSTAERATLWPMNDRTRYLECRPLEGSVGDEYGPVQADCLAGEQFYFFSQCCREPNGELPSEVEVCPMYPPINTPPPLPTPVTCLELGAFDPDPIIPFDCDEPRCGTAFERTVLWPSSDPQEYFACLEELPGLYGPVLQICPPASTFDFLLQCCSENAPVEENVCGLFVEPLPALNTLPLPIVCDKPRCETERERAYYWPATERRLLYICEPQPGAQTFAPRQYACAEGQVFHLWKQDCVDQRTTHLYVCPHLNGTWANGVAQKPAPTDGPGAVGPILTPPNIG